MRLSRCLAVALSGLLCLPALPSRHALAQSAPPHSWLFGSWTGGLFPVPPGLPAQICLQQPTVIFTRDVVLRAAITDQFYGQRLIETVRGSGAQLEFRFTPAAQPGSDGGLLGLSSAPAVTGFGCADPDVLTVLRKSENEISFPGCSEFPNPLVRCLVR